MAFLPKYVEFRTTIERLKLKDNLLIKLLIAASVITLVVLMFPRGEAIEYEYKAGSIWVEKDLIAPFSFPIYKEELQYEKEKREAASNVYPIFGRSGHSEEVQRESLETALEHFRLTPGLQSIWIQRQKFGGILDDVLRIGIVDQRRLIQLHRFVAMRKGTEEELVASDRFFDLEQALNMVETRLFGSFREGEVATQMAAVFRRILQPNVFYNQAETEKLIRIAIDNVPRTVGFVQENERIVGRQERITEEIRLKLDSLRKGRAERAAGHSHIWQYLGVVLHVGLVTMLFGIYLFLFRKRLLHDNTKLAIIALLIVIECFFAYLSLAIDVRLPFQFLILVPAASMLLTIIFDSRLAFYGTVTIALLIGGIRGNDYAIALASLVVGALAVSTVRDIKHRTQIFRSLIFIFLGYALIILALGFERFAPGSTIMTELAFALSNAVFSPVLTYGLLIFFERVFNVTTDLTLLELSDFTKPLLRELSEKAPGTFHHSVTLGSLAEAAAEAVGANAVLARVGAYHHDIGKLMKPEYFVENQSAGKSRHNRLRPRMSALIIASHVKDGIELGRGHGIPQVVLDFIPQHHGTTLMSFFYEKAVQQAAARKNPKDDVHEEDYRYPGPKPQTKETGIVMLADAVDATARVLDDPTPQKLEAMIDNTIKTRFMEGQLDECELTLRDLTKIKEAFLKILAGIHHMRIKYPEQEKEEKETAPTTSVTVENVTDTHQDQYAPDSESNLVTEQTQASSGAKPSA